MEVCKTQPEDPVDYLAEYLFKYSVGGSLEDEPSAASGAAVSSHAFLLSCRSVLNSCVLQEKKQQESKRPVGAS